jgi:glycerol-3-phosphate dehydrogenase
VIEATSATARAKTIGALSANPRVQVLIIGGGINGAAVFRDLALQGVDCLLVDKDDWCAGTSAAPSRLIHGGLKYLETGEFRLVAESTRERNLLLKNAPHFVRPLATVMPIQSYFGGILPSILRFFGHKTKMADRGLLIVELGLALYDLLGARHRVMPRHSFALRCWAKRRFPRMSASVVATATYYDARVTQAERLCYELVADAQRAHNGARALNYMAASTFSEGRVVLVDQTTRQALAVEPEIVINAAGPWIDRVNHALSLNKSYIGGAKGSHLIVDSPELVEQLNGHMVYFGSSDGRICLVYPFFGHALLGSTDIKTNDPDSVVCDDDETAYMLAMLAEIFPDIAVTRDQVIYRYAGIRPLPASQAEDPAEITRDHSLARDTLPGTAIPILSMIGGKWTTFRAFAAETTDIALATIGRARQRATDLEPIGGGRGFPITERDRSEWIARQSARSGASLARTEALLERYGAGAHALLCAEEELLASLPGYSRGEIQTMVRSEQVVALADIVFRRTSIAIAGQLTAAAIAELAGIAEQELNWSEAERERQIAATSRIARERHGVGLGDELPGDEASAI